MPDVPPFATELEAEDARQEVEAKLAGAPISKPRADPVIPKPAPGRPRPPAPPAAEAADGVAPDVPAAELHVPEVIKKLLRGEI